MTVDTAVTEGLGVDEQKTLESHVELVVEFTLLNSKIRGIVLKEGEGTRLFVSKKVEGKEGVTLAELVTQVTNLVGETGLSVDGITKTLNSVLTSLDVDKVTVTLKLVYLDVKIPSAAGAQSSKEYAFLLEVAAGAASTNIKAVTVDRILLAVWNTADEAIKGELPSLPKSNPAPK